MAEQHLTKSELAIMEVMWEQEEALTASEIIKASGDKEWKNSSIHLMVNALLEKGFLEVAGFKKTTKNYARTFVPVEGKEQFLVGQVIDNKITSDAKKRIYSYIIEKENNPEMIKYVEKLLEERKKELGVKSK